LYSDQPVTTFAKASVVRRRFREGGKGVLPRFCLMFAGAGLSRYALPPRFLVIFESGG
jgi:hypothetical protein